MTNPQTVMTTTNFKELVGDIGKRPELVPEFKTLNEIPRAEAETFLLYGASGSGKTRILGGCGSRALIISNGGGLSTIQSPSFKRDVGANPIVVELAERMGRRGIPEEATVHDALCDTIDFAIEKIRDQFDFVCIDDATFLRRGAMYKGLILSDATNRSKTKKDIVDEYDEIVPAVQDFGMEMSIVETFLASYTTICKQAGKHFIVCAHERLSYKAASKIGDAPELIKIAPSFTGVDKNPSNIALYFDNVWRTEVIGGGDQRQWRVTTKGHETLIAKTRIDGVFKVVERVPTQGMWMRDEVIKKLKEAK